MIPFKADKKLAEKRIAICEECEYFKPKTRTCGTAIIGDKIGDKKTCGCFMDAKTKLSFSRCPFDKWEFLQVTENDYLAIKKLLDEIDNTINPKQKEVLFEMQRKYIGGNTKTSNCVPCIKSALKEMKQIVEEYEK
tara:strand:+ start:240 stop:647 length:408 start_codon:yes stop_codon:yes gene_type:complete